MIGGVMSAKSLAMSARLNRLAFRDHGFPEACAPVLGHGL
jgi:hypothetical protein